LLVGVIALSVVGFLVWKPPTTIIGWFRSAPSLPRMADTRDTAARPKIGDRIGGPSSPDEGTLVAPRAVLYEEEPNDPAGKRYVGSAAWRTKSVPPAPGQAARPRHPDRYRNSRTENLRAVGAGAQRRQGATSESHGRADVHPAAGFPPWRDHEHSGRADEAIGVDAGWSCHRWTPTARATSNYSRKGPGLTSPWSTATAAVPSSPSKRAHPATVPCPRLRSLGAFLSKAVCHSSPTGLAGACGVSRRGNPIGVYPYAYAREPAAPGLARRYGEAAVVRPDGLTDF
jgi:hypothetical protein